MYTYLFLHIMPRHAHLIPEKEYLDLRNHLEHLSIATVVTTLSPGLCSVNILSSSYHSTEGMTIEPFNIPGREEFYSHLQSGLIA